MSAKRIWLTYAESLGETCWNDERINDTDTEYVRADVAESDLREVARRALQEDGDSLDASSAVAVVDKIVRDFLSEQEATRD